ncbi:MAG TPA: ABC transporter substrate-binding protein [Acidimicrobiales bacterium]|nr:ABC transporter substrate-binding protein [Acidimicrobiales bacterium]
MLAAACGDDGDDDTEASDDTTEDTSEESAAPATGEAAPSCEGEEDGTFTIGALLPETGDLAGLGPPEIAGAQLAVEEINAGGGVNGTPITYLPGDSGDSDPDIANPTVDGHLENGADMILGAASSGISLNVIDKITGACKIHFSPANTSKELSTYDDDDLYFRTAPSDILQGAVLADLIIEEGNTTLGILARQDSYGEGLLEDTKGPFEEQGGEVVYEAVYDPEAQTFESEVQGLVTEDPDALALIGFEESSRILTSLIEQGFTPQNKKIYMVDGNTSNTYYTDLPAGALNGVKGTSPLTDLSEDFTQRLLGVNPGLQDYLYAGETYDAVLITALAAQIAGTDNPAEVAAQINGVTRDGEKCGGWEECLALIEAGDDVDYDGASGPQEFSQNGEPTEASFGILVYRADINETDPAMTEYVQAQI